jgi:hypothetical protein
MEKQFQPLENAVSFVRAPRFHWREGTWIRKTGSTDKDKQEKAVSLPPSRITVPNDKFIWTSGSVSLAGIGPKIEIQIDIRPQVKDSKSRTVKRWLAVSVSSQAQLDEVAPSASRKQDHGGLRQCELAPLPGPQAQPFVSTSSMQSRVKYSHTCLFCSSSGSKVCGGREAPREDCCMNQPFPWNGCHTYKP